jgi:hypothetical protein
MRREKKGAFSRFWVMTKIVHKKRKIVVNDVTSESSRKTFLPRTHTDEGLDKNLSLTEITEGAEKRADSSKLIAGRKNQRSKFGLISPSQEIRPKRIPPLRTLRARVTGGTGREIKFSTLS